MKKNAKKVVEKVEKKVVEPKKVEKPKDSKGLSEKQTKALALIKKGTTRDSFISQMGIEAAGFGGLIGNMRKKGLKVEMDKSGRLSIGK